MWWTKPRDPSGTLLLPPAVLELLVRAFAIVEVGGITGLGPDRGRRFERLFYRLCDRLGVHLTERAGGRSVAGQRSASGLTHEVDGATRAGVANTYWELKHLSVPVEKNELLIFNAKALDFLYDASRLFRRTPLLRFLMSGQNLRDECRLYAIQWGIIIIEPNRLPLPLIYEALMRGCVPDLSAADQRAVSALAPWACRSLQQVTADFVERSKADTCTPESIRRRSREVSAMQEQIGSDILDMLEAQYPEWLNDLAQTEWDRLGGWA
jgi:hypothetical protein